MAKSIPHEKATIKSFKRDPELLLVNDVTAIPEEQRVIFWLLLGKTGISSKTIVYALTGINIESFIKRGEEILHFTTNHFDVPYDPSDFRRCLLLLELFPEWRARLPEVAEKFPRWKPLVDAWDELEALYAEEIAREDGNAPKLYARMKELLRW